MRAPFATVLLFVVALGLRLGCLPLAHGVPHLGDASEYVRYAIQWASTGEFGSMPFGMRPPLTRVFMAWGLDTSVEPFDVYPGVYLVQVLADLLNLALLVRLTRRHAGVGASLVTGAVFAVLPQALHFSVLAVHSEPFNACFAAGALTALDALDRRRAGGLGGLGGLLLPAVVFGLLIGGGMLVKQAMLMTGGALGLAWLGARDVPWSRRVGLAAVVALAAVVVVLPWRLHTERLLGAPLLSGTYGAFHVLNENAPPGERGVDLWRAQPDTASRLALSSEVLRRSWLEYPDVTLGRMPRRLLRVLGPEKMLGMRLAMAFDESSQFSWVEEHIENLRSLQEEGVEGEGVTTTWDLRRTTRSGLVRTAAEVAILLLFSLATMGLLGGAPMGVLRRAAVWVVVATVAACLVAGGVARYRYLTVPFLLPFVGLAVTQLAAGRLPRRALVGGLVVAAVLTMTIFVTPVT